MFGKFDFGLVGLSISQFASLGGTLVYYLS